MKNPSSARAEISTVVPFPFFNVRHITSPEDEKTGRKVYVGYAPVSAILDISTNENVREYLLEGRKKRVPTQVHRAIRDTLENNPEDFGVLNGGIVLVARACEVDEKQKCLHLTNPSIINGSQTQGIIREHFTNRPSHQLFAGGVEPHIKYEVVVTDDEDLIANVSIARNFQNDVMAISIVGRRGHLDELEERFQRVYPRLKLRKSETDVPYDDNNFVDTERLIQVIAALVPEELWLKDGEVNKVYTYSQKTKCLKEFADIYKVAKDTEHTQHERYAELYQFYLDVAPTAYELHQKWKIHQGFRGTGLRAIRRDERGEIEEVPDGIVFPILASLAEFAEKTAEGWAINVPEVIDNELIQAAKSSYQEVAKSNPAVMGKSKACYVALAQITSIVKRYLLQSGIPRVQSKMRL